MPNTTKYSTGEYPTHGDVVRGYPNKSDKKIAGLVIAHHEGLLSICFFADQSTDVRRVYGEAKNFELLARNESGL